MEERPFVAVNEQIDTAGTICWWRLSGEVSHNQLRECWEEANLDVEHLPEPPTTAEALMRACMEQKKARVLVRPLKGQGFAIVQEQVAEKAYVSTTRAVITLSEEGDLCVEGNVITQENLEILHTTLGKAFERHKASLAPIDISNWVIGLLHQLGATSLRERGGIYFIPQPQVAAWNSVVAILRQISNHKFFCVPAMRSEEAVAAILDSVEREAKAIAEAVKEDLQGKDLGAKALRRREQRLMEIDTKLAKYEQLLGCKSDSFHELISEVSASVSLALFAAESEQQ